MELQAIQLPLHGILRHSLRELWPPEIEYPAQNFDGNAAVAAMSSANGSCFDLWFRSSQKRLCQQNTGKTGLALQGHNVHMLLILEKIRSPKRPSADLSCGFLCRRLNP
ncbi:hypothetical protein QR680_012813 [Steinernema hermaphroditum]|uniref:Uncharacterized protein n=1 Tax=Steinernema hermaphroditum TaxID=289476 RepID=A0AA39M170_9BILA|nr:hypothetical protein QR680_012813 [Steinernema hermaphroditum]